MNPNIVVGGGISGLILAQELRKHRISFVGLEKSERVGGRDEVGHHRILREATVEFLRSEASIDEWDEILEPTLERHRGEWLPVKAELTAQETFYASEHFFWPKCDSLVSPVLREAGIDFRVHKQVVAIEPESREIVCHDEERIPYEKVFWCAPLDLLTRVWKGEKNPLLKALKSFSPGLGGINLSLSLNERAFPSKNTLVVPFKHKDRRLRALGFNTADLKLDWILFLEKELVEDREELVKCIRSFKRELQKEFPDLLKLIRSERIVFLPALSGEVPAELTSLEMLPNIFYAGPQARLETSEESLRNLDLIVENVRQITASAN